MRARISLDLFVSVSLSPRTGLGTENATSKHLWVREREVAEGGKEGGLRKGRMGRREGKEGRIGSQNHTTAGSCWCFPGTTSRGGKKKTTSECAEHTFPNFEKVPA